MSPWKFVTRVDASGGITRTRPYRASDDSFRPLFVTVDVDAIKEHDNDASWARAVPMTMRPDGRWI